jgi:HK97 family phage portal protein
MTTLTDFSANGSYELLDSNVIMYDEPNYAVMVRTTDLESGDLTSEAKYIDKAAYELLGKSKLFGGVQELFFKLLHSSDGLRNLYARLWAVYYYDLKNDVLKLTGIKKDEQIEEILFGHFDPIMQMLYLKLDNKDVKALVDSVYLQYGEVIGTALKAFKKTNGTKYKLLLEQYRAGDPAFVKIFNDVIQKDLKTFIENDNAVYPQYKGLDLQEFSSKNPQNTSDIISMRKEIFEVVAQAFKIPLSMMYGNITNMNEIVKVYLSFCIDPLADMISEEMTRKCFTFSEWEKGCYVKVDTSCINHVDILEVADKLSYAIGSGAVTIDDLRNRIDLPELDNEFSKKHFITKNYAPAEDMANPMETMKGGE